MSTLLDRPNSALIVIDVQNGFVAGAHRRDAVVATIADLVERSRQAGVPVLWVRHSNHEVARETDAWRIVPELTPHDDEPRIDKRFGDSFEETNLESVLAELRVGRLIVTGVQTDACIRATIHGAFVRGYDVTLVSDAHTTEDLTAWGAPSPGDVIAHTNLYWSHETAPGRIAEAVESMHVAF